MGKLWVYYSRWRSRIVGFVCGGDGAKGAGEFVGHGWERAWASVVVMLKSELAKDEPRSRLESRVVMRELD